MNSNEASPCLRVHFSASMQRYCLTVEYDGSSYQGWQRQTGCPTVQETIEDAIRSFSQESVTTTAAGRTDAGVHALGQVIHFDLERTWHPPKIAAALNYHLRQSGIAVVDSITVEPSFDARRSAIQRHYRYRILVRNAPPALDRNRVWHHPRRLDAERMHEAGQFLLGYHDFTSFRASECQAASPNKTIDRLHVFSHKDEIWIEIDARSFLHHQVRNIAGTLAIIGEGKKAIGTIPEILAARDRPAAGPTAPARGLYLVGVNYPPPKIRFPSELTEKVTTT